MNKGMAGMKILETKICKLDHDVKTIFYYGYDLKDLAKYASFEQVVYLLLYGNMPTKEEQTDISNFLRDHQILESTWGTQEWDKILRFVPENSDYMDILKLAVSFYGTIVDRKQKTEILAIDLMAKISSILSWMKKRHFLRKSDKNSFAETVLQNLTYKPLTPLMIRAFNTSLILYAEHELAASTFAARVTASTLSDYYSCVLSAIGTLKGPLHGGANEAVMRMLLEIRKPKKAEEWIKNALKEKRKIMGFGHRVYKDGDPRSPIIESYSRELSEGTDGAEWYDMSKIIEETIVKEKGLYPNLDFYTASVYHLLGIPVKLFTPIFVLSRLAGWSAHIIEQQNNNHLIRPEAEYAGEIKKISLPLSAEKEKKI